MFRLMLLGALAVAVWATVTVGDVLAADSPVPGYVAAALADTTRLGILYPLSDREGFDLLGRQWHQSDVAPIAYGFAVVFLRSLSLHRNVCEALASCVPPATQNRLLPPRTGIAAGLRAHPACPARPVCEQAFHEQARIRRNALLLEQRKYPLLDLPKRGSP